MGAQQVGDRQLVVAGGARRTLGVVRPQRLQDRPVLQDDVVHVDAGQRERDERPGERRGS